MIQNSTDIEDLLNFKCSCKTSDEAAIRMTSFKNIEEKWRVRLLILLLLHCLAIFNSKSFRGLVSSCTHRDIIEKAGSIKHLLRGIHTTANFFNCFFF